MTKTRFARLMPFLDMTKTHFARFWGVFGHDQNVVCPFYPLFRHDQNVFFFIDYQYFAPSGATAQTNYQNLLRLLYKHSHHLYGYLYHMKAIVITQPGGPEVLQLEERLTPVCAANEVLIKVHASGVNRPDVFQRKGNYPPPQGAPQDIPGLEIAGVITETGAAITRWKVGDKVCALVVGGGYAEYCNVPEGQCLPIPGALTFQEAASLPETFFTVWSNAFDRGQLKNNETLLVHGGSSGIGVTAIQTAKALGHTVYVTAGSADKCRFCEELGAAKAINYKTENFADVIKQVTNGKGVDVILDMIGGDYTAGNLKSLADEGRLVLINAMNGNNVQVDLSLVMRKRLTITGSMLRSREISFKAAIAQNLKKIIWPLISSGKIKPVINKVFAADKASEAHKLMESGDHVGKIVLSWQ